MKAKKFLTLSMLVVFLGLIGGCHYGSNDDHRDRNRAGSYREGYRDGRAAERRNENWRDSWYNDRDYWRRR
jgi:hypothetical protein